MISDSRILLRAVEPSDVDMLLELENDNARADASVYPAPVSRYMIEQYIRHYTADFNDDGELRLIIADAATGAPVGALDITGFDRRNHHAYVGIAIIPRFRRNGYALAAITLLCSIATSRFGIHHLAAIVATDNDPSLGLFRKAAFKSAGCLRSWIRRDNTYSNALIFSRLFP